MIPDFPMTRSTVDGHPGSPLKDFMRWKSGFIWFIVLTGLFLCASAAIAVQKPVGILILKSAPSSQDNRHVKLLEYVSVTGHLVPVTDYVTVVLPDGSREEIQEDLIIQKVEYPGEPAWNLLTDASIAKTVLKIREYEQVISQYPQTGEFLEAKLSSMKKEEMLFSAGNRKLNGKWITGGEYQQILEAEKRRLEALAAAKKNAEEEAARKKAEELAAMQKRMEESARMAKVEEEKRSAELAAAAEAKRKTELSKLKKSAPPAARQVPASNSSFSWQMPAVLFLIVCIAALVYQQRRNKPKPKGLDGPV